MKKLLLIFGILVSLAATAQQTANRFFYELSYAPNKDSVAKKLKEMMILDITQDKSIYRDYLMVSQDSALRVQIEAMQKSGTYKDISKSIKQPKFSHTIVKSYPSMGITYSDFILQDIVSYKEDVKFNWKIEKDQKKIGEYNTQKATTDFGGRKWTAWFTTDLPFQDGPYKFYGLPGLIVQIQDDGNNYSWLLQGNKKISNYTEQSYTEELMKQNPQSKRLEVSKEKYQQMREAYKKDPFGSIRTQIAQIPADFKAPDGRPFSQVLKEQEAQLKKTLNENNNEIEVPATAKKKK